MPADRSGDKFLSMPGNGKDRSEATPAHDVEFIRIFFPKEREEIIAHRWACRLALVVGPRVQDLRPETTLDEMLSWAAAARAHSIDFVMVFEPELRMEMAGLLDDSAHVTFRDIVVNYSTKFES